MSDYVFPQFNDYDDPQNFAFHLGQSNLGDFVEYGLSLTADHAAETFDLTEGKAYVQQTDAVGDASGETRHRLVYAVHVDATAGVGFATTSGVNYVWLDANLGSQDSPQIVVETNDTAPSDASLKLGSIDAGADSAAVELNREPTATFGADNGPGLTVASGDLRIPAGGAIEDDAGQSRIVAFADRTELMEPGGGTAFQAHEDFGTLVRSPSGEPIKIEPGNGLINASNTPADLRLATGRSVEGGSGVERLTIESAGTKIWDDAGQLVFKGISGSRTEIASWDNQPVVVRDNVGGFNAIKYLPTSSSPGEFELSNAKITHPVLSVGDEERPIDFGQTQSHTARQVISPGDGYVKILGVGGGVYTIFIDFEHNGGNGQYTDQVMVAFNAGTKIIDSVARATPPGRTYQENSGDLELDVDSGEGDAEIRVLGHAVK